jgi:hypothetical protein
MCYRYKVKLYTRTTKLAALAAMIISTCFTLARDFNIARIVIPPSNIDNGHFEYSLTPDQLGDGSLALGHVLANMLVYTEGIQANHPQSATWVATNKQDTTELSQKTDFINALKASNKDELETAFREAVLSFVSVAPVLGIKIDKLGFKNNTTKDPTMSGGIKLAVNTSEILNNLVITDNTRIAGPQQAGLDAFFICNPPTTQQNGELIIVGTTHAFYDAWKGNFMHGNH